MDSFSDMSCGLQPSLSLSAEREDTNVAIGLTGFLSLGVMLMAGYAFYHLVLPYLPMTLGLDARGEVMIFLVQTSWYFIYAVFVLLIVNLFPMISSDIFLLIIAISPSKLIPLMKNDTMVKGLLIICIVLGGISSLAVQGMEQSGAGFRVRIGGIMTLAVKLQVFEGPLDLLLHLIDINKIDIYDIPIS